MNIKCIFDNSRYLDIALIDKPAIRRWFDRYNKFSKHYTCVLLSEYEISKKNESYIQDRLGKIQGALREISELGLKVPYAPIPPEADYNQVTLNTIHRFFTYNASWGFKHLKGIDVKNPFDEDFVLPKSYTFSDWFSLIDILNQNVHDLEMYCDTTTKKYVRETFDTPIFHCTLNFNYSDITLVGDNIWMDFTDEEKIDLNSPILDYSLGLPVTLNRSILGKCYLQCFVDHDNPLANDVSGREGSYGGFCVHTNQNRQKIYESDRFTQWTEAYGLDSKSLPLDVQIGYLTDTNISNLDSVRSNWNLNFQNIMFYT
jgi:hypothetical protein